MKGWRTAICLLTAAAVGLCLAGCGGTAPEPVPTAPVEAGIFVPKLEGAYSDGFLRGTDVSSLLSVLNGGARFRGWDGAPLGDTVEAQGEGFLRLLSDAGFNWIRLRVWNDPYDAAGHGYGGGNCDLAAAAVMGKWAADAGLRTLIDFHCSDFWADPGKQQAPKAWQGMALEEKSAALRTYVSESLRTLLEAGVDVGMVQVGNETTNGFCGETDWNGMAELFRAGAAGVREVSGDILVALHFTNPEWEGHCAGIAAQLDRHGVDYDVFACSYYPYWHGTPENLTAVLRQVAETYGKLVLVAETSWAYTLEDGDGSGNTVAPGSNDADPAYTFSVQGQADALAAVTRAVLEVGSPGLGVFYWENAWIPPHYAYDGGALVPETLEENRAAWERYGCGWASSYAAEYDPEDAGRWYGGSAVDNQAMFDFSGYPLESLRTFRYMRTGAVAPLAMTGADAPDLRFPVGTERTALLEALEAPVTARYNNGETRALPAVWENAAGVNLELPGDYVLTGSVTDGETGLRCAVTRTVTVTRDNLLRNPGFEEGAEGYVLTGWEGHGITDGESSNVHEGGWCLHFYSPAPIRAATAAQTLTLSPGTYAFTLFTQGGDVGENGDTHLFAAFRETVLTEPFSLTAWREWKTPELRFTLTEETEVTVGVSVTAGAGAWGSFDDWSLTAR